MKDINALMVIHFWFNINWGCFLVVHECWQRSKFWQLFKYVMLSLGLKSKVGKLGLCHLLKKKKEKENKCECVWCILPWVGPVAFLCPCDSVPGLPVAPWLCRVLECIWTWSRVCFPLCVKILLLMLNNDERLLEMLTWNPNVSPGGQRQLDRFSFFTVHSSFLASVWSQLVYRLHSNIMER